MKRAIDPDRTTVNQAISLDPERVEPLARLGIDTCCGGSLTLRVAAERHGVDLAVLLEAIGVGSGEDPADEGDESEDTAAPAGGSCSCCHPVEKG